MAFQRSAGPKRDFCFQCAETVTVRAPPHNTRRLAFARRYPLRQSRRPIPRRTMAAGSSGAGLAIIACSFGRRWWSWADIAPRIRFLFFCVPKSAQASGVEGQSAIVLRHTEFPRVSATSALGQKRTLRNVQCLLYLRKQTSWNDAGGAEVRVASDCCRKRQIAPQENLIGESP